MDMTPVGSTARWVAANRALESELADPLSTDPFARALAGESGFAMMSAVRSAIRGVSFTGPDPVLSIRTRFFDDAMLAAVRRSSITQAVIVAAGMDARAFRLDWPPGCVLFEVDRGEVFDEKEPVLRQLGATPRCDRRVVRADLTGQWRPALLEAGFDPSRPSAFLVEGLLYYLGEPASDELLRTIAELAPEDSWMGVDLISTELLTSAFFTSYLDKLREVGCPWTFGVTDPEAFLAGHGWEAMVVTPGEPAANYDRWPYPVVPRTVPGLPRTFLAEARRRVTAVVPRRPEADDAAVPVPIRYHLVRQPDLVASFGRPDTVSPVPGVLTLGGSEGGFPEYFLDLLVPHGFACMALAYFGVEGAAASLADVSLERIERGLRWLAADRGVQTHDGRVAVIGASRGGELALLVAATFPDLVGPVVAYTPSSVVWPGIDVGMQPTGTSSWTFGGEPVPFVPFVGTAAPLMSERGLAVRPVFDRALDDAEAVSQAAIRVERATGPLLLISGGSDQVWPAERMCRMVVGRMAAHGRGADVKHLDYPSAGHALFPYSGPSGIVPRTQMRLDFGGTAEADKAAHLAAWRHVVAHLRGAPLPPSD